MGQKRKRKHHRLRQVVVNQGTVHPGVIQATNEQETRPVAASLTAPAGAASAVSEQERADYQLMRRDLLRVLVVVSLVIAGLVALMATNRSSGWLNHQSNRLYHWLRLG